MIQVTPRNVANMCMEHSALLRDLFPNHQLEYEREHALVLELP